MALALAAVQENLRSRARPLLRATEQTLIGQLREDGKLLSESSRNLRLDGSQRKCLLMSQEHLLGQKKRPTPGSRVGCGGPAWYPRGGLTPHPATAAGGAAGTPALARERESDQASHPL
jgi:hypothetical protein